MSRPESPNAIIRQLPTQYSFTDLKAAVRARREAVLQSEDLSLVGKRGNKLTDVLLDAEPVISGLVEIHSDYVNDKLNIPLLAGSVPHRDILQAFGEGFETAMTQEYRVRKHINRQSSEDLIHPDLVANIALGYAFDFYRALRVARRQGLSSRESLVQAKLVYRTHPNKLNRLLQDPTYKDLPLTIIVGASANRPLKTEEFLDNYITAITQLGSDPRYYELPKYIIQSAAFTHSTDPEGFLDRFIQVVNNLSNDQRYSHLPLSTIQTFVLSRKDPEEYLDQYVAKVVALKQDVRFQQIPPGVIDDFALRITTGNTELYLLRFLEDMDRLSQNQRYSHLSTYVLHYAAQHHSTNPEGFLDTYMTTVDRLTHDTRYAILSRSNIEKAVLSHVKDPEAFLDRAITVIRHLSNIPRFSNVPLSLIRFVAVSYPRAPEHYMDERLRDYEVFRKDSRFSTLSDASIRMTAFFRPNNLEGALLQLL